MKNRLTALAWEHSLDQPPRQVHLSTRLLRAAEGELDDS
jgi:hypothetical protein